MLATVDLGLRNDLGVRGGLGLATSHSENTKTESAQAEFSKVSSFHVQRTVFLFSHVNSSIYPN